MLVLIVIVYMFVWENIFIEASVFCGDPYAMNHTYVGPSCPLKCANILAIIEQLKQVDYHRLLHEDQHRGTWEEERRRMMGKQNRTSNGTVPRATRRQYNEYIKVLVSPKTLNYIRKELDYFGVVSKLGRALCRQAAVNNSKEGIFNSLYNQCIRRTPYEDDFVRRLTRFLNRYAKTEFQFTKAMVVLFLRKVVGTNIDLRQGNLIAPKVIAYLREALEKTALNSNPDKVHIAARNCLGIYVPGCFCKTGYLEEEGKCISMKDCLTNNFRDLSNYMERIVLH